MSRPVGGEITDITPVSALLVGPHTGYFVVQEVIGIELVMFEYLTDDRTPEVVLGAAAGIVRDHLHESLRVKDVVPHGGVCAVRVRRHWHRLYGLFLEADDAFIVIDFDDAEAVR